MPIARFQMPDGRIGRFEVPDGTSPEQAQAMISAHLSGQSAAAPDTAAPAQGPLKLTSSSSLRPDNALARTAAGAAMGVSDLGNTVLNALAYVPGKMSPKIAQWNRTRNADMEAVTEANKDSTLFNGARIAGNVAATMPVGGLIGKAVQGTAAIPQLAEYAPQIGKLANAIRTSGTRTGAPLAADAGLIARAADLATRSTGAAINGGASAALTTPDHIGSSAAISALLPPGLMAAAKLAKYGGNAIKSVVQPFTKAGQDSLAAKIIQKFGEGGPMEINAAELVPGSAPTLAESTGNAGIATLQRGVRDLRPNAFAERETANAAARNAMFGDAAGDAAKLEFYKTSRETAAKELYDKALSVNPADSMSPYIKGQITQLMKRPSVDSALGTAKQWALERGEKPSVNGSIAGLHDMKTAIDDQIAAAVRDNQGGQVKALTATRDKLLQTIEKLSPDYAEARATYAAMSKPVNAMESLQSLRLTDARGNMTLAKVKNAVEGIERLQAAPGVNPAKSIAPEQMEVLRKIQEDLLRQDMLGKGRSIGSNTFQNLATDNILASMLPGRLGMLAKDKAGGVVGQVGKLAYSGPNEAIRNRLTDMMLTPDLLKEVLARQQALNAPNALERFLQLPGVQQPLVRAVPAAPNQR